MFVKHLGILLEMRPTATIGICVDREALTTRDGATLRSLGGRAPRAPWVTYPSGAVEPAADRRSP